MYMYIYVLYRYLSQSPKSSKSPKTSQLLSLLCDVQEGSIITGLCPRIYSQILSGAYFVPVFGCSHSVCQIILTHCWYSYIWNVLPAACLNVSCLRVTHNSASLGPAETSIFSRFIYIIIQYHRPQSQFSLVWLSWAYQASGPLTALDNCYCCCWLSEALWSLCLWACSCERSWVWLFQNHEEVWD